MDNGMEIIVGLIIGLFIILTWNGVAPYWKTSEQTGFNYIMEDGVECKLINVKAYMFFVYETNFSNCDNNLDYKAVNNYKKLGILRGRELK